MVERLGWYFFLLLFVSAVGGCKPDALQDRQEPIPCVNAPGPEEACIPGGTFIMGHERVKLSDTQQFDDIFNDFDPPHEVRLDPFFLDKYEVTNGEYKLCVDSGVCEPIRVTTGEDMCSDDLFIMPPDWDDPVNANVPVLRIEFENAEAYCRWMGKRLPTEAEWERAARGPQSFDYPWGNQQADCARLPYLYRCNHWGLCYGSATEVPPRGSSPGDISVEGVFDLNGSVAELVADFMDSEFYSKSPVDNPVNLTPPPFYNPSHIARGDDYFGGGALYIASTFQPEATDPLWKTMPSWIRKSSRVGTGFRCARDDGMGGAEREFIEFRNKIIKGVWP